ncbi:ribonuclease Z [Paenibacillus sp. HB172176]|uniref:ribonuclease Z n=1 Tax=Paenibacillus sp. HB172176 TaxID=2493690 RepID=UPI003211D91B
MWFMGTGAGRPNKHRNVSGLALQMTEGEGNWWLFDAGEATQHQVMQLPLKPSKLEKVFVTHMHGDHVYGLPGLLSSRSFDGGETPIHLYGPKGIKSYLQDVFRLTSTTLDYELVIHELNETESTQVVVKEPQFTVTAMPLAHRIPCYGYRIVEQDCPGKLLVEKLKALGVKEGPLFGKLKNGESVALADGSVVHSKDVTNQPLPGRIVTILGDTRPCASVRPLAEKADLLVHEATFAAGMETKAHEFGHSTTLEAARAARDAGAKQLALTHFSGRYSNEQLSLLEQEAASVFPNTTAALDLSFIDIKRRQAAE